MQRGITHWIKLESDFMLGLKRDHYKILWGTEYCEMYQVKYILKDDYCGVLVLYLGKLFLRQFLEWILSKCLYCHNLSKFF